MATTNDTMNQPTTANEADKLLTPAQKALNHILRGHGAITPQEKELLALDAQIVINALSAKEPCRHR
jgi:hypothetical protein